MPKTNYNPISWVPSVYFAMGLPFVVLNMMSVLMYKGLGISDSQIALWTSIIMIPWTLKFLWSPFLELYKTKKFFVVLYWCPIKLFLRIRKGLILFVRFSPFRLSLSCDQKFNHE